MKKWMPVSRSAMISTFVFLTLIHSILTLQTASGQAGQGESTLSSRQGGVAQRYEKLEELLLRLADVEADENPERAALLRRAAKQSRDQFILEKLKTASQSLQTQEFQKAVDNQEAASKDLSAILTLLLSEDRSKRIRDEKERYQNLIKNLKRNLNNQRSARARTENGADLDEVQKEQKAVTQRSEQLAQELSGENDSQQNADDAQQGSKEDNPDNQKSQESKSNKEKQDQTPEQEQDSSNSDQNQEKPDQSGSQKETGNENSESSEKPDQQSQQQQSQQQQSQQQQSQQQQSQQQQSQQQPQTPEAEVEQQLQEAIKKMQQAEQELEQAKREQATEKQRQAEENLRAAIDRLERILRQLREEELQRELAKLEARLRKMAAMQTKVLDDTIALSATPRSQRNRQTDLKAGDLSFEEKKITLEADRAMLLLREEGSSVAFPEVVSQIRSDTVRVSEMLAQTKIDAITQGIQQDILAALEEMIGALQKAQRDLEKKRQQQQQQGQNSPPGQQEQPLVEAIAELKLIRTMEVRIKSTTDRYSALLESGDTTGEEMLPLLQDLSERQDRIDQITRDLVLKRNQ